MTWQVSKPQQNINIDMTYFQINQFIVTFNIMSYLNLSLCQFVTPVTLIIDIVDMCQERQPDINIGMTFFQLNQFIVTFNIMLK